ncbi:MAG: large conductance mechanosensitive channel protein MscL [Gaiellaceae bacterium]
MIKEFRDFLMRGNLVELAVAFVMGLAFAALVTSFVDDLILPIVAMVIGKPDFGGLTFTINDAVFRYGAFVTAAITFVTTAAAIFFFVVKRVQAIMTRGKTPEEEAVPDEERRHQGAACGARQSESLTPETDLRTTRRARRSGRRGDRESSRARGAHPARTPRVTSCRAGW